MELDLHEFYLINDNWTVNAISQMTLVQAEERNQHLHAQGIYYRWRMAEQLEDEADASDTPLKFSQEGL